MPDQVERLVGCQKPDACEWGWWPDHCQCPNSEGNRCAAPEPIEMVRRNQLAAADERNRSEKALQERLKFAAEVVRRLEADRDQARKQRDEELRERLKPLLKPYTEKQSPDWLRGSDAALARIECALDSIFEETDHA